MEMTKCPVCGGLVDVHRPAVGLEVECPECGEALKVILVHPLELYYALEPDLEPLPDEEHRVPRTG